MSAALLRAARIGMGVAAVASAFNSLSSSGVARASLIGPIGGPDPFQDKTLYFPEDLKQIDHWIEFQAKETKGQALPLAQRIIGNSFNLSVGNTVLGGKVVLPMPSNLSTDYNPDYSAQDLGLAAGQVLKPADQGIYGNVGPDSLLSGTGLSGVSGSMALGAALGGGAGAAIAGISSAAGDTNFNAFTKVTAGVAQNPHKIVLFTGVNFRDHRFSWKLSPKNRAESDAINDIINFFTYYSHPEYVAGGLFFKYPEFFDIKFHHPEYLFELQGSVCNGIQINYHGQGYAAYIRNSDGSGVPAPAEVELTLTFKETEIITKNTLRTTFKRKPNDQITKNAADTFIEENSGAFGL